MVENSESRVAHPAHYQTSNGLETIDVMEAFTEDMTGYEAVCTSNVLKYVCRWKKKNGLEDLKKAEWYLKRLIERIESSEAVVYSADGREYRFTK